MKTVTQDITDRLALLDLRHSVVFGTLDPDRSSYELRAGELEEGLRAPDNKTAVKVVRAVVDPADLARPQFWATSLGRLLFAAGGFTDVSLNRTDAALILACSRQWVHELVSRGVLKAAPSRTAIDREVFAEGVREVLKARMPMLDGSVK